MEGGVSQAEVEEEEEEVVVVVVVGGWSVVWWATKAVGDEAVSGDGRSACHAAASQAGPEAASDAVP